MLGQELIMNALKSEPSVVVKTVMLATDFQRSSRVAFNYARYFAKQFEADLIVLNAFQFGPHSQNVELIEHVPSRVRREAEARLASFTLELAGEKCFAKYELIEGTVPSAIQKAVEQDRADLLVLGIHRGMAHLVGGSNTEALMLNSPCPTLTVGPCVSGAYGTVLKFEQILYIADGSQESAAAAPFVRALAYDLGTSIKVFHLHSQSGPPETKQAVPQLVDHCKAILVSTLQPSVECEVSRISSLKEIKSGSVDAYSLIVLSVQPGGYIQRHLRTSVAYDLVADATCPILTVPIVSGWLTEHVRRAG
jgi:nucleotide-binding universal stress UspA family protein